MLKNEIKDLISLDRIFDFFKRADYNVETDRNTFPVSELIEKEIEGEVWTVINETNLAILIVKSSNYNRKSYRNKVNNYLKELAGTQIIFYTDDFSHYNLTLIFDGIFNIKFNPSNPDIDVVRIFEAFESQEDLFDYTKQDINFILLKRQLTAKILKDGIRESDNSSVKLMFQDGGIRLIGESLNKVAISFNDAPIRDLAIDIKLGYKSDIILDDDIQSISTLYKQLTNRDLKLVCIITEKGLLYHWLLHSISGFVGFINQLNEDVMDEVLESLIAQLSSRTAFNSETFHQQFGTYSPFFILGITAFQQFFDEEQDKIKIMYEEWKSRFSKVYQAGDLDQELFIKHAYLSLLIKTVLISKFVEPNKNPSEDNLQKIIEIFEERGVPIFLNDFFQWTSEEIFVQKEVFEALHNAEFIVDDLFRTIYQEMVSPATRHALGEFYTPAPLAHKMAEEVYEFGQYVLDPACGSGTFLIEILNIIYNSNKRIDDKIEAVSKIYGFDVNPIAVLVARSNMLLLTDKLFPENTTVSINVFLADSLNPIKEFSTKIEDKKAGKKYKFSLDKWHTFGEVERFTMPSINDALVINIKLLKYTEQFGELLKELDRQLSKDLNYNDMLDAIYLSTDVSWLNELCEGSSDKKLKDNFEYIAKKLHEFIQKDKNHIWAYLLYNAIGVRKMKHTMDGVDLIIGNPPWLTLSAVLSHEYKAKIKDYSKNLGIYVGSQQAPHTELCSIFFYKTSELYLRKNGKIFFVTTAGIETTNQHSKFRLFKDFKDIMIWKFLKDVFRIHNICVYAKYSNQTLKDRLKVNFKIFEVNERNKKWEFELKKEEIYVPYNYDSIEEDMVAKRFIPISNLEEMLPNRESFYKKKFRNGATIVPRSFFFITITKEGKFLPNKSILRKEPWDFYPIKQYNIENDYVFSVCKSTELVPFKLLKVHQCFLPIEQDDYIYHNNLIKPKAQRTFNILLEKYREIQERDQRVITNLWKRIDFNSGLRHPLQRSKLKIIYNSTGSILKSALIKGNIIVDSKFFYMGEFESIEEAMFICTVLNAPCLTIQLKKTGGTGASGSVRDIHLRALDFPIPKYNSKNELHFNITNLGKEIQGRIEKLIENMRNQESVVLKKKVRCKICGKLFNKKTFERYRENHQNSCNKVEQGHNWTNNDWVDLKDISPRDVDLSKISVQNAIFNDSDIKGNLDELDKLVVELLNSEDE